MARRYGITNNTAGKFAGYTASQLKRMSKANRVAAMVDWFHMNYEDPANRLPYQTAEGGYQWIWGGPYDAVEEIEEAFGGAVDFDLIEQAASEVQEENGIYEWAPVEKFGDRDDEPPPDGEFNLEDLGLEPEEAVSEEVARDEMLARLAVLEEAIAPILSRMRLDDDMPGIGHNNPPPEFEIEEALTRDDWRALQEQIESLRAEAASPAPRVDEVEKSRSFFAGVSSKIGRWAVDRVNAAIDNTGGIAIGYALANHQAIIDKFHSAVSAISTWLSAINIPF